MVRVGEIVESKRRGRGGRYIVIDRWRGSAPLLLMIPLDRGGRADAPDAPCYSVALEADMRLAPACVEG